MDPARFPVALSSWAVHHALGARTEDAPAAGPQPLVRVREGLDLRDLPAAAKRRGIGRIEIVHFHLDRTDDALLDGLREALTREGVVLQTLLIDDGDLSGPDADRHEAWIAGWIDVAHRLGAQGARIIGGKTRRDGDLEDVAVRLRRLAADAPLPLLTENWHAVLHDPERTLRLLDLCEGRIGLNVDLGNWTDADVHDRIERIAGRASVCHAKCDVVDGENDLEGFGRLIDAVLRGGYRGPLTLVNGAGGDREWALVEEQAGYLRERYGSGADAPFAPDSFGSSS